MAVYNDLINIVRIRMRPWRATKRLVHLFTDNLETRIYFVIRTAKTQFISITVEWGFYMTMQQV